MTAADRIRDALREAGALPDGAWVECGWGRWPMTPEPHRGWWLVMPGHGKVRERGEWLGRTSAAALRRIRAGDVAGLAGGGGDGT